MYKSINNRKQSELDKLLISKNKRPDGLPTKDARKHTIEEKEKAYALGKNLYHNYYKEG